MLEMYAEFRTDVVLFVLTLLLSVDSNDEKDEKEQVSLGKETHECTSTNSFFMKYVLFLIRLNIHYVTTVTVLQHEV